MARYYVRNGVKLICDQGAGESNLTVTSTVNTKIKGQNWATEADKDFGTNFGSFGACGCNGGSGCAAVAIGWANVADNVKTGGNKYILHDSELLCSLGGTISIMNEESGVNDTKDTQKLPSQTDQGASNTSANKSNPHSSNSGEESSGGEEDSNPNEEDEERSVLETQASSMRTPLDDKARAERRARLTELYANEHKDSWWQETKNIVGGIGNDFMSGRTRDFLGNYAKGVALGVKNTIVGVYQGGEALFLYTRNRSELYLSGLSDEERLNQMLANYAQDDEIFKAYENFVDKIPTNIEEARLLTTDGIESVVNIHDNFISSSDEEMAKGFGGLVGGVATGGVAGKGGKALKKAIKSVNIGMNPKGYLTNLFKSKAINSIPGGPQLKALYDRAQQTKNWALELKNLKKLLKAGFGPVINKKSKKKTPEEIEAEKQQMRDDYKKAQQEKAAQEQAARERTAAAAAARRNEQDKSDPVDVITGTVVYDYVDFEIPGIIPVRWERNWYSDSKYKGPLGHGYHHNYDINIEIKENLILLTLPDGRPAFFPILTTENNSNYNSKEKITLTLLRNQDYELFDHEQQLTYSFKNISNIYRPSRLSNVDGVAIAFQYKTTLLDSIIDTAGRIINIHSNEKGLINKITAHHKGNNRLLVSYDYNEAGDMIRITDAQEKSVRIGYKNHLMVSKTHRLGQTFNWEYEALHSGARCIRAWGDEGLLDYSITYEKEYNIVIDSLGHQSLFYYENNLATKIIDPLGGEIIKEYDRNQNLIKFTDEEGSQTNYEYDTRSNISALKLPDGSTTEYIFDEKGKLQLVKKPEGGIVVHSYKNDRLDSIIEPDGMMTTIEYNEQGLIYKVYDNQDQETLLFYDEDYNLIKTQLPNGAISSWEYDCWGQCIKTVSPLKQQQEFSYDVLGNISKIKLPDNSKVELQYDSYGRIVKVIDNKQIINYQYTLMGNLRSREQDGRKVLFRYNNEEQLIGIINEHNESYSFTRDPKGNIITEEGFDGLTRRFIRDKAGKVIKVERPDNKYSIYEYDKGGRISRVEHQDGTWATYSYNKDGLLIEAINPNSHVKFNRDEAGRILSEDQDSYIVTSQYGESGIRSGIKSSLGADINFEHSIMGEVMKMNVKTNQNKPWEAHFSYNSLGMETERILPGSINSSWDYDITGNPKQHRINSNNIEQRNRTYAWDVNSKLQRITNILTHKTTRFNYDAFNSLASAQYEDGSYDYKLPDEVGNLYRTKSKKDREYGKSGKLLRSGATTYNYNEEGNLIAKDTPKGIWKYQWEAGGMLKTVLKPDKTKISFEYDALGRRTGKIVATGYKSQTEPVEVQSKGKQNTITRWVWDGNVPLHEWQYSLNDRPKTIVDESGNLLKDAKEPIDNLVTWIFDQGTFRPAAKITEEDSYSIITDYLGTPVEMYNSQGEKTWQAEYDMYGKVRKLVIGSLNDCPFRYQGQYEDPETGLYYNRFRYYSPNEGVYISQDPIGLAGNNPNLYAYTEDNNIWVDVFGLAKTPTRTLQKNWLNYVGSKHTNPDIHHGFPEEFADDFKRLADIDVNNPKYYYNLPKSKHTKKPGIHTNSSRTGQNWNKTWKGLINQVEGKNLSKAESKKMFEDQLKNLARKERISKHNADAVKGALKSK